MTMEHAHQWPGLLVVAEGVPGAGKSTHLELLRAWLIQEGYDVFYTPWEASKLVKPTLKHGRRERILTPSTQALLQATDFADFLERTLLPPLQAGMTVLAAPYAYTAICGALARGMDGEYLHALYGFAPRPDLAFYFRAPPGVAARRLNQSPAALGYYDAGLDLGLSRDPAESHRLLQARLADGFERLCAERGLIAVDTGAAAERVQNSLRPRIRNALRDKGTCRRTLRAGTRP